MTVKTILDQKGRDVTTALQDMTLSEAATILAEHRIGAVVIVDKSGRILGILSERDIVRAVAEAGHDVFELPVSRFMTKKVTRCHETHTIHEVMGMMTEGRFRHLPVDKDGKLDGIVSIGDVVRMRIEEVEREAEDMRAYIAS